MEIVHSYAIEKDHKLQWLDIVTDTNYTTLSCKDFSISCNANLKDVDLNVDTNPIRRFLYDFIDAYNTISSSKIRTLYHGYKIYKDNKYHYYSMLIEYDVERIFVIQEFDCEGNFINEPVLIHGCLTKLDALKKFLTL